jgi:hypothetical protein
VDLETLPPDAASVARLASIRPESREAERAIACWLGFAEIPEAVAMLGEMESRTTDKELRREIRRSRFRLEQRGLSAGRPASAAPAGILSREKDRGFLSPVDGRGDQVIWYVREEGSGDYFVLSGVVNDRRGLVEVDAGRVARPALRELLEETHRRFALRLLPADPAWCDLVLHEGYLGRAERRNPRVGRFPSYRMEITHQVPEKIPCPVHEVLDPEVIRDEKSLLESSDRLLEERELSGWRLDSDYLVEYSAPLQDLADSPLVLNRIQKQERLDQLMRGAAASIFGGDARKSYARRLEAAAYYFLLDDRREPARRALAVSRVLEAGSEDAATLPFVAALVRGSFTALREAQEARAAEEKRTSLIVKPGEK